jgi:hypothetical protein
MVVDAEAVEHQNRDAFSVCLVIDLQAVDVANHI